MEWLESLRRKQQNRRHERNLLARLILLQTEGRRKPAVIQFNCYCSSHALKIREVGNYVNLLRAQLARRLESKTLVQWLFIKLR